VTEGQEVTGRDEGQKNEGTFALRPLNSSQAHLGMLIQGISYPLERIKKEKGIGQKSK